MNATHRRGIAATAGAALLGVTLLTAGGSAWAAPQDYGNIDEDRTGSLTVHKYLQQSETVTGDPSQGPAEGAFSDPVAGVGFTIYPLLRDGVAIDVTDGDSWADLSGLTPGAACTAPAGLSLGAPVVMPDTDSSGTATASLPLGAYQVCETTAPADIIDRAQPFIVVVPTPHQNGWVYDVHAYPKNSAGEIIKSIEQQSDLGLGSVVTFPVTVPVPRMGEAWSGFAIRDVLDSRLSPVDPADVAVTVDGAPLDSAYYTVVNVGQEVTFAMTAEGLAWLDEGPNAHVGAQITVAFSGTIEQIGDGEIPNTAVFFPNNPDFDPAANPSLTSNEVKTTWGDITLLKRASGTSGTTGTLSGAVFEIYAASDPYADDCTASTATGVPISVDGQTSFTSDADGTIVIGGLFVSDSVNPAIDATQRCYVLKETVAPAGYVLPADPFTPVAIERGTVTTDNIEIENSQPGIPVLPFTGSDGQLLLGVAGVGALAVMIGLILARRKKSANA